MPARQPRTPPTPKPAPTRVLGPGALRGGPINGNTSTPCARCGRCAPVVLETTYGEPKSKREHVEKVCSTCWRKENG